MGLTLFVWGAMQTVKAAHRRLVRLVFAVGFILVVPFLAMRVTDQVVWTVTDFVVAGVLLLGTSLIYELAARKADTFAYRAAVGVALGAALTLIWLNLAVGVIGTEGDRANVMYLGVLAIGFIGAVIARFRPQGMARALFAMALAQAGVAVIALIFRLGARWSPPMELVLLNGFFVALFVASALLFRRAAQEQGHAG
jgi:hypothetical protein